MVRPESSGVSVLSEPATVTVDPTFTKITNGTIATDREVSEGCAWADYDNDGDLDLFVANFQMRNALYRNEGGGSFTRVTTGAIASEPPANSHGCAWADYNNDGWPDLYVSNVDQLNFLYKNLGGGEFVKIQPRMAGDILLNGSGLSVGIAWADFNRDGWIDLFVPNGGITKRQMDDLYRNNGDGTFSRVPEILVTTDVFISDQGAWADYDNDGDPDLFVSHYGSERSNNSLYRNNGDGVFEAVTDDPLTTEQNSSIGAAWADYDNDGDLDLFVTARRTGPNTRNSLFRNRGDGTFEKVTDGDVANDGGQFFGCAWVDYDNDGWLDLFVGTDGQQRAFYRNNGDGTFTRLTEGSPVNDKALSVSCAWGDYDNDGFPDLFVANGWSGADFNSLYRNNGNDNEWIKVRCIGTLSNRSAIGARIRLKASINGSEVWQMREISGGSGYLSQNSLEQCFGLGDANGVDTLRVEWPSGVVQEYHGLSAKQTIEIVEPIQLQPRIAVSSGNVELRLAARTARPLQVEASADLAHWSLLGDAAAPENGVLHISDPEADRKPARFYRVRNP